MPRCIAIIGWTTLAVLAAGVVSCQRSPPPKPQSGLAAGIEFLLRAQSPDGAWRSDTYGTFRDGTALTPLVVVALFEADATESSRKARRAGSDFLAKMARVDESIDEGPLGLDYPSYTAALSVIALSHPENADLQPARDAWLNYLLARQLTEPLGWTSTDKEYGGWGYCRTIPRKPDPAKFAAPLIESNLSATIFALDALVAAGYSDTATIGRGRAFALRCRNPDGGFHFIYDDPIRNKAGGDANGFFSYGSATADGYRAVVDDPARQTAAQWLRTQFDPDHHPGRYLPAHERNRDAVYFYYAASVSRFLRATGDRQRAERLAAALLNRQQPDGSWCNSVDLMRENDSLLSTAWAVIALSNCSATQNGTIRSGE